MDPVVKAKWTAALRSGNYQQGTEYLQMRVDGESYYCCLGVLCELAIEARISVSATEHTSSTRGGYSYVLYNNGNVGLPPGTVLAWARLEEKDMQDLIEMNDNKGTSFHGIAKHIDENL
jgi:hypothetical protein